MVKYLICEALGCGKIGQVIDEFETFADLIKAIKSEYKSSRYLVTNAYANMVYFTGLQVEDCYLLPDTHKFTKDNLTWNYKYDMFTKGYMYI